MSTEARTHNKGFFAMLAAESRLGGRDKYILIDITQSTLLRSARNDVSQLNGHNRALEYTLNFLNKEVL